MRSNTLENHHARELHVACRHHLVSKATSLALCLSTVAMSFAEESDIQNVSELAAESVAVSDSGGTPTALTMEDLQKVLTEQQQVLQEQNLKLEQQTRQIDEQHQQIEKQQEQIDEQQTSLDDQVQVLRSLQTQFDQLAMNQGQQASASEDQMALMDRLPTLEDQLQAIPEDPRLSDKLLPGAIALPGTNATLRFGGYVKLAIIKSFDPLISADRFIVGGIPVTGESQFTFDDSNLTSSQSRVNLDLNEETALGNLRAFVEGDFDGTRNTFRLRHAYGRFKDFLAGQTWSVFHDTAAIPDELDFEGINGQVNVRQSQLRYLPKIGRNWDLSIGLEDPDAQITELDFESLESMDAEGVSDQPDITFSVRRSFQRYSHMKFSSVFRQISARSDLLNKTESEFAWGFNISGVRTTRLLFDERDNVKWQLTYGKGIGRYINDLDTLGGMDGVFDEKGKIRTLPVVAGYLSVQHWWSDTLRSTFLVSGVWVDNYSFQPPDSYKKTERVSGNLIYSPVNRFDVGWELIWGRRTNEDDRSGKALQTQVSARYQF